MTQQEHKQLIEELLSSPDKLRKKRPFTRGIEHDENGDKEGTPISIGETIDASTPRTRRIIVSQDRFMRELDPSSHDVLFDENLPSICVKVEDGSYREIKHARMAIPIQRLIKDEQVTYLTSNKMQFTQVDTTPTKKQVDNFTVFKQYWDLRNQDGMKTKAVDTQLSYGEAGLLYYFDYKGRIKSRLLSYADGYVICSHNDQNGDRIVESVYYVKDNVEYIDSYDDTYMTRWTNDALADNEEEIGWKRHAPVKHGFNEIPLATKRGDVAWSGAQSIIEVYEEVFNVFNAIQKRLGWGILYIKGKFARKAERIAGSVILNDTSMDGNGDAKYLTPPSPDGMLDTLKNLLRAIQIASSTTFILPDDIRLSGDVSGLAVQLTKELDLQNAMLKVIEWQNFADKMVRLFKYGLAKELVNYDINPQAITEFEDLHINAKFKVWRPFNDYEFNQMLTILTGAGILSKESGIELSTVGKPDEKARIQREAEESMRLTQEQMMAQSENNTNSDNNDENNGDGLD